MALLSAAAPVIGEPAQRRYASLRAWIAIAILMVFSLLSFLDRQILALLVGPIKADLQLSDTELALLQGFAFALLYSVAGLPLGWAVDRYPRRPILYIGITLWSLSAAFCGLARNFWLMFAGRTAVGVGEATMQPVAVSLIGDLFPPERIATAFGVYSAGYFIGSGVAMGIGGLIVGVFAAHPTVQVLLLGDVKPWQAVFLVTGLPGIAIAFLAFLIRDPGRPNRPAAVASSSKADVARHLRTRGRVTFHAFVGFSAAAVIAYVVPAWSPAFFMRHFGWGPGDVGWTFGLAMGVSGAIGAVGGGAVLDRVFRSGRKDAYFLVPGLGGIVTIPLLGGAYLMPTPLLALICLGLGMAIYGVTSAAVYSTWRRIAVPELRGRMTAAYILCGSLFGGGLGPVFVGLLTDRMFRDERLVGYSMSIVLSVSLALMALLLLTGRSALRAVPD